MKRGYRKELKELITFLEKDNDVCIVSNKKSISREKCLKTFLDNKLDLENNDKLYINKSIDNLLSIRVVFNNGINYFITDGLRKYNGIANVNKEVKRLRNLKIR